VKTLDLAAPESGRGCEPTGTAAGSRERAEVYMERRRKKQPLWSELDRQRGESLRDWIERTKVARGFE
jgi:hypothetical protein